MDDLNTFARRSRVQIEDYSQSQSKVEDSLKQPMRPVIEAHFNLQNTYNNLDNLINEVVLQNEWLLNSRFLNRLKQEEEKLQILKEQLGKDYFEIENNPEIFKLHKEMESYVSQTKAINRYSLQLEGQIEHHRRTFNQEKEYVDQVKEHLKELTKENLKISYAIEETKIKTDPNSSRSKFPSLLSKSSISVPTSLAPIKFDLLTEPQKLDIYVIMDELHKVKRDIQDVKVSSSHLSNLQGAFLAEQKKLEEFFQDCFEIAKLKLIHNQQIPQINKKGLAGSLFFDLIQNEKANHILGVLNDKTYRSSLQERDSKNILYYTVKRMIKTAKYEQRKEQISSIKLSREEFFGFTSLQVLGLLCLRNDIQVDIHLAVFPANLMHVSHNSISELKKSQSSKKNKP